MAGAEGDGKKIVGGDGGQESSKDAEVTLYYHEGSHYSRKVLLALHEKGIAFKQTR